jgi:hypothetical protein
MSRHEITRRLTAVTVTATVAVGVLSLPAPSTAATTPVANALSAPAAQVLTTTKLTATPAMTITVSAGPGTPAGTATATRTTVTRMAKMVSGTKLGATTIIMSADSDWVKAAVNRRAAHINPDELAAFNRRYDAGEMSRSGGWAYSLRGPNYTQTIALNPGRPGAVNAKYDWTLTAARELSPNFFSATGGSSYPERWPCWAAEGLGYPLAYHSVAVTFGRSYASVRNPQVNQLRQAKRAGHRLGLAASERFAGTPSTPCMLPPGVGHLQGALAGEMLLARGGVPALLAWANATPGKPWTATFETTYRRSVAAFYRDFDRNVVTTI